ncbi:MAG: ABC transporter permease [Nitrospirales bacterium]|nr:ABC transporter permease [Nitrospira sp.]MDR4501061.1 ABC transporter permease [Nitrospirales bacterium]
MRSMDVLALSWGAITARPARAGLSLLGIAIGVLSVILLTSVGEGTRRYVLSQFTQFGTNLLTITRGKTKTIGIPGVLGGTTHPLTLEDAEAIRQLDGVIRVVPVSVGNARVESEGRGRSVSVFGVTAEMPEHWKFNVRSGSFLPSGDPFRRQPIAVLGPKLKTELFGDASPLGSFVRIAGHRFRVIGVMARKGTLLGFNIDDAVYVPVASAMSLFNMDELNEIQVAFGFGSRLETILRQIRDLLVERHRGEEDFTIVTQAAMLDTMDGIMKVITVAVAIIGGISLVVGAIGIMTVMWMVVRERTGEIGLLKATGATSTQIYQLFLCESVVLAMIGGASGLVCGLGIVQILTIWIPQLPVHPHPTYIVAALTVSSLAGICSGFIPARYAASIDPVIALHTQ